MNPLYALAGLVAGLIFGLCVGYGIVGPLGILVGVALMLGGTVLTTPLRSLFGAALFGFLVSWIVYGGLELL